MNIILLTGRLTKDPELAMSKDSEKYYCKFTLAVDRGKDKDGNQITDFPRITAFGKQAENMPKYLEKGCLIAVLAELRTSKYEKDGQTQYSEDLIANKIEYIEWKKDIERPTE